VISLCLCSDRHPRLRAFGIFDGHGGGEASLFLKRHLVPALQALSDPMNAVQLTDCLVQLDRQFGTTAHRTHGSTVCLVLVRIDSTAATNGCEALVCQIGKRGKTLRSAPEGSCVITMIPVPCGDLGEKENEQAEQE
jgi:hypothetical protein